jgi:transposase IS116/IS110/IS902 family protein
MRFPQLFYFTLFYRDRVFGRDSRFNGCSRYKRKHGQTILTEVGPNVARLRNASAFASWLGPSPEKQVSGGKALYTKTRKVKNRAAIALRLGASCLYHAKNYLGEFFRRMKFRLNTPQAITTTAHNWLASFITCCEPRSFIQKAPSPSTMN